MKLYFLRHGQANWEHWDKPDEERPLTKKGQKEVLQVAHALLALKVRPGVILTSPLPRAYETAKIVSDELDIECLTMPQLAPGFDLALLNQLLSEYPDADVMLVGHEPDFSTVVGALTGGTIKLAKAGVARVDVASNAELRGELVWLVPPKVLKEI